MRLASASFDLPTTGDYARDWALVDVETSGLIPRRDRVLSVAVITIGPDGEQTGEFSTLLDPGPVDVHGLTAERLRGAPTFDRVAERIGAMLQNRVLVRVSLRLRQPAEADPDIPLGLAELVTDRRAAGPALLQQIRQKHPHISSQWSRD